MNTRESAEQTTRIGDPMKPVVTTFLALAAAAALAVPTLAVEEVVPGTATTMVADDGTIIYCVTEVTPLETGEVVGGAFVDCPTDYAWPSGGGEVTADGGPDLNNLTVGDSFVDYSPFDSEEFTTVTLQRAESGIKTSRYSKPDKGMTTLALFFTFEASDNGGNTNLVEAFSPDGVEFDRFYSAQGKYDKDWGYTDLRPGKSAKGWAVFEVPKRGKVEVVMEGYDVDGDEVFATWVVRP